MTYVVASEVTTGSGFAHRLSIVSTSETPDDANNRTIQRAGSNFDHAKARWAEVMLKRDAVVYTDMTAAPDKTFSAITAGTNMTGEVVDGVLVLTATPVDDFETVTTQVLKIVEGPDNPGKFSQAYVDGNLNTTFHAIGDTHFYQKDKTTGELTEAFQVDSSGRFVVKQKVKTPVVTNLSSGTTNSSSSNAGFVDLSVANEVKLGAKSKVSISVNGSSVAQFEGDAVKLLKQTDLSNQNLVNIKHLVANAAGSMNVAGVKVLKRDDSVSAQ